MFLKKLFGGLHMSWPVVVVFAVVAGAYTGVVNQIPALANTSFSDIAVTYECWVLFAAIVATNCEKPLEAALKTFVFFAISQPVVFLVELPMLGTEMAATYLGAWLIPIVLTFPGGALAWRMKKGDWLSVTIVVLGAAFLGALCASHAASALANFPRHLLSAVFCVAIAVAFAFRFVEKPVLRALPCAVAAAAFAAILVFSQQSEVSYSTVLPEGDWETATLANGDGATAEIVDGDILELSMPSSVASGNTVTVTGSDGETLVYDISLTSTGGMELTLRE